MLDVRLKEKSGPLLETLWMLYVQTQNQKKNHKTAVFWKNTGRNGTFFYFGWTVYFNYRCHQKALISGLPVRYLGCSHWLSMLSPEGGATAASHPA